MADSRPCSPTSTDSRSSSPVRSIQSHGSKKPEGPPFEDDTPPTTPGSYPTVVPLPSAKGRRRKMFGMKHAAVNPQRGNDPFDYEQKYAEDEKFKEMGSMARLWRVFLDECAKFDAEMVDDWRDGLDVLLVFAGLFSAVVTTFVAQTCQRLEADFTEVNAHLMYESINIDRARAAGLSILDVPRSQLTPFSRVRPSQTAVWVNGLWFTSLALSLTTALMAVLTKQWIHQYMSVPSGTPRDRSRIRQFRYMSLQRWQVPVIIGLLPVLMHIALGVFFAGLIVYLYSLNTAMSGVVTGIASTAFIVYFLTNLLPLYKPDCPYKTPLTIHSYAFLISVWDRVRTLTKAGESLPSKEHLSLKAVERETVTREADAIDAQSVAWLHNVSSNSSVQRIVLQALSNLPLGTVDAVRKAIPDIEALLRSCLWEYGTPERRYGYERLSRAFIRFDRKTVPHIRPFPFDTDRVENSLVHLLDPDSRAAVDLVARQIIKSTVELDAISWLSVFSNALFHSFDWLEIGNYDSVIWTSFLKMFLKEHRCYTWAHDRKEVAFIHLLFPKKCPRGCMFDYEGFKLIVCESGDRQLARKSTSDGILFERAVGDFMYPSLCDLIIEITAPFVATVDETLPSDIRLHLALVQIPEVQMATQPVTNGMVPFRRLISFLKVYVDIDVSQHACPGAIIHHQQLPGAVFTSLRHIVTESKTFVNSMCERDQRDLVHILFRALVLDGNVRKTHERWLDNDVLTKRLLRVIFPRPRVFSFPLITQILEYFYLTKSLFGVDVYRELLQDTWFHTLDYEYMLDDPNNNLHTFPLRERSSADDYAFPFLVVAYVDGLEILEELSPAVYEQTMECIQTPANLSTLCRILILGDVDSRNRMWKLAKLAGRDLWEPCMANLLGFLHTGAAEKFYKEQSGWGARRRPQHDHVFLNFSPFEELVELVGKFSMAWQWGRGNFPLITPIFSAPKQLMDFSLATHERHVSHVSHKYSNALGGAQSDPGPV